MNWRIKLKKNIYNKLLKDKNTKTKKYKIKDM